jgi:hypothetical protein
MFFLQGRYWICMYYFDELQTSNGSSHLEQNQYFDSSTPWRKECFVVPRGVVYVTLQRLFFNYGSTQKLKVVPLTSHVKSDWRSGHVWLSGTCHQPSVTAFRAAMTNWAKNISSQGFTSTKINNFKGPSKADNFKAAQKITSIFWKSKLDYRV